MSDVLIKDLLSLDLDTEVELFEVSNFDQVSGNVFRFCSYSGVIFNTHSYNPLPASIEGIEYSSEGSTPRPKLRVSDVEQLISGLIYFYNGIEGSRVTIRKTLRRFLDGQPSANPLAKKPDDIFLISQITQMVPGKYIEFELAADFDFVDEMLPRRICSKTCPWIYRSTECGYTGTRMFTVSDVGTLDPTLDACGKTIQSCERRFGRNVLPHGGFPALSLR